MSALNDAGRTLFARGVGNYTQRLELFAVNEKPDAVFVANDHMAFTVMDVLRFELGLKVPDDVSVVSYDDVPMASWLSYDLTTVRQPTNRMVKATLEILQARIEDDDSPQQKIAISSPLIVRGSARKPIQAYS